MVIDASLLAKYILREDNWEKVALVEVSNAIWKHCMLYKKVSHEEAKTMFDALKKLRDFVAFEPFEKYLDDAMGISMEE